MFQHKGIDNQDFESAVGQMKFICLQIDPSVPLPQGVCYLGSEHCSVRGVELCVLKNHA